MPKLLRRLFLIKKIYGRKTVLAATVDYLLLALLLTTALVMVLSWVNVRDVYSYALPIFGAVYLYMLLRAILLSILIKKRFQHIRHAPGTNGMPSMLEASAISDELEQIQRTDKIASTDKWQMYEAREDVYRQTKYGNYLSRQLFYSVLEIRLQRALPNIIFDSKRSKGHQFRYLYLKSQRLSLEGGFDDTFTVYAPEKYKIDTLSFVTPEVMLAFKKAHDFDIELLGDRLFLYGPLLFEPSDVENMQRLGELLAREIDDNIDNYADSYLSGADRRRNTTRFARHLLRSPLTPIIGLILCLVISMAAVVVAIMENKRVYAFNELIFLVYIMTASYAIRTFRILRDNKRARQSFGAELKMQAWARQHRPAIFGRNRS